MRKIISMLLGVLMLVGLFSGCKKKPPETPSGIEANESGVISFSYSYQNSDLYGSYTYAVRDGMVYLELGEYPDYGELSCPADSALLDQLTALYQRHNLASWDGYHKVNDFMLDGDGFSLSLGFADGQSLSASGSNCFPEGYGDFSAEMLALFAPIREEVLEEARQRVISGGLHGRVEYVTVNFHQNGSAGSDEYKISLAPFGSRENNFDVQIVSNSGEFIAPGEYRYQCAMENLDFDALQSLIEKYELIQWYNYRKTAEDYSNAEWFQLELSFDDGFRLSAMGTEPPEHYEEFRQEFLQLIVRMAQES